MTKDEYKVRVMFEIVTQGISGDYCWVAVDDIRLKNTSVRPTGHQCVFVYKNIPNIKKDEYWIPDDQSMLSFKILIDHVEIDFDWKDSLFSIKELFE